MHDYGIGEANCGALAKSWRQVQTYPVSKMQRPPPGRYNSRRPKIASHHEVTKYLPPGSMLKQKRPG
jgi:hypothetical protein